MDGTLSQRNLARSIAEDLLDRSGRGLMDNDFDLFAACFLLPHEFDTFEGRRRITTQKELRAVFDGLRAHFASMEVTIRERRVIAADFVDGMRIRSTHESRLIVRDRFLKDAYAVMSELHLTREGWKVARASYALPPSLGHEKALRVGVVDNAENDADMAPLRLPQGEFGLPANKS